MTFLSSFSQLCTHFFSLTFLPHFSLIFYFSLTFISFFGAVAEQDSTIAQATLLINDDQLAEVKDMLERLGSADPARQVAASKDITDATKWAADAPPGQRTEQNRPCREAVGTLGGVERLCALLTASHVVHDQAALVQHWGTLGQLCLCPKNAGAAATNGLLRAAHDTLFDSTTAPGLRAAAARMLSTFSGFCSTDSLKQIISSGLLPLLIAAMTEPEVSSSTVKPQQQKERTEREWCISTLTALARNGALREELLDGGLAEAFGYLAFTEGTKLGENAEKPTDAYLKAAFGLACLVGQEENHPAISNDLDRTIGWIVEDLRGKPSSPNPHNPHPIFTQFHSILTSS